MKKMRIALFLIALLTVLNLTACGGGSDQNTGQNKNAGQNQGQNQGQNKLQNGQNGQDQQDNDVDVVTTASIVSEPDAFINAVSENGTWIIATLNDITLDEEVIVAGQFHDKGKEENKIYRKIAAYAQDENRTITDSYTITVPRLIVRSENLNFQGGTLKGDVYVQANGFLLHETATVDGNIYFANEEYKESSQIDGNVSGAVEVLQPSE